MSRAQSCDAHLFVNTLLVPVLPCNLHPRVTQVFKFDGIIIYNLTRELLIEYYYKFSSFVRTSTISLIYFTNWILSFWGLCILSKFSSYFLSSHFKTC